MHVQVLTCRYDAARGVLDDEPLRSFCRDKVVLGVRDHFFVHGDTPHIAFVARAVPRLASRVWRVSLPRGSQKRRQSHGRGTCSITRMYFTSPRRMPVMPW